MQQMEFKHLPQQDVEGILHQANPGFPRLVHTFNLNSLGLFYKMLNIGWQKKLSHDQSNHCKLGSFVPAH